MKTAHAPGDETALSRGICEWNQRPGSLSKSQMLGACPSGASAAPLPRVLCQ